jgi:excisionase family DNA binding protein
VALTASPTDTRVTGSYLTPADVAELLGLAKLDTVYALIRSGDLAAANVSPSAGRPCWRISRAALDSFLESRTSTPTPPAPRRRTQRPPVTRYF